MWELFIQDAQRWVIPGKIAPRSQMTWKTVLSLLYRYMSLRAMLWFRVGSWCKRKRIPFMTGYCQRQIHTRYGLQIIVGSDYAGGLYVAHPVGVVIAARRIGRNCSIIASNTLGMRNEWAFPEIGDNVFIGAGARVLGGIQIGDNAVIGANAVVIHDVPADTTVVGIPARPVRKSELVEI